VGERGCDYEYESLTDSLSQVSVTVRPTGTVTSTLSWIE